MCRLCAIHRVHVDRVHMSGYIRVRILCVYTCEDLCAHGVDCYKYQLLSSLSKSGEVECVLLDMRVMVVCRCCISESI